MNIHDRITLGGFVALAALIVTLFAWLRADVAAVEEGLGANIAAVEERLDARMERLENGQIDLRERMARLEGELSAVLTIVDVAMARDTPPSGETAE